LQVLDGTWQSEVSDGQKTTRKQSSVNRLGTIIPRPNYRLKLLPPFQIIRLFILRYIAKAMHLNIHHVYIHSKSNVSRKVKTSYNLERIEYNSDLEVESPSLVLVINNTKLLMLLCQVN
jgi:hypothetical protein